MAKLFGPVFVVLDALFFVSFLSSFFDVVFIFSRSLLGSILSSQTDPPTLPNIDFILGIFTFWKNQRFRSNDGFGNVLGFSRAPFESSWGSLGRLLGALWSL